jgi:hypothetical protein
LFASFGQTAIAIVRSASIYGGGIAVDPLFLDTIVIGGGLVGLVVLILVIVLIARIL